jgi:hypothetical protein
MAVSAARRRAFDARASQVTEAAACPDRPPAVALGHAHATLGREIEPALFENIKPDQPNQAGGSEEGVPDGTGAAE